MLFRFVLINLGIVWLLLGYLSTCLGVSVEDVLFLRNIDEYVLSALEIF